MSTTDLPDLSQGAHAHDIDHHTRMDPHRRAYGLSDIILGGQDGLVNVLGVILGVAAATQDLHVVLAAGLAATLAESVSMGAVSYTSNLADHARYESERQREYRHLHSVPAVEREEIRLIYERKGFAGPLLDRIVETITADKDVWVAVMMAEEHQLTPIGRGSALRSALVVGVSAIIGSLIPLLPFLLLSIQGAMVASVALAAAALFAVGAYKARVTIGRPGRSGLEIALIGTLSALAGYLVGLLFRVPAAR